MTHRPRTVTIVSANDETLDELVSYLERAGLEAHGTKTMTHIGTDPPASVVVFFPDEFPLDDLLAEVERLRNESPRVVCVIVTKNPGHFTGDDRTVVIPKPAWGWTILDAIHMRERN
jgi:hypothetical protein